MMVTDTLLVLDNLYNRATVIANVEVAAEARRRRAAPALRRGRGAGSRTGSAGWPRPAPIRPLAIEPPRDAAAGHHAVPRRPVPGRRAPDQGVHRRRRHLPDRALPPAGGGGARSVPHLPLSPRAQPRAVPVLPALRRHPRHRQLARDPGAGGGRRGHAAADRRHPARAAPRRRRTRRWPRSWRPTPRSAPST